MLTTISWQLVAGGLVLVPVALLVEGAPPALSATNLGGLLWLTTMGTAVAYYCWFRGLVRMPAGAVAIVGLVNPVVGTLLGVLFAGELFGWAQALGMVLVLGGVVAGQRLAVRPQRHHDPRPRDHRSYDVARTGRSAEPPRLRPVDPDDDLRRWPSWVYGAGSTPDPRFSMANERTFLAWVRTSLALLAGGVALDAVDLDGPRGLQRPSRWSWWCSDCSARPPRGSAGPPPSVPCGCADPCRPPPCWRGSPWC